MNKDSIINDGKKGRIKLLVTLSKGYRWFAVIAVSTMILSTFFNYLMPQVLRFIVDSVLGEVPMSLPPALLDVINKLGGREYLRNNLLICAIAAVSFSVFSGVFNYFCRISMAKLCEGMVRDLRDKLYSHIQRLPYSWQVKNQTGDIIQRCTSDMEVIRNFVSSQLLEVVRVVVLIVVSLAMMFAMNVKLTLIAVAFMPILIFYSTYFFAKIAKRFRIADEAEGSLSAAVQENLTGVRVVRAFGRQAHEIERFDKKNNYFADLWVRIGKLMSAFWCIGDVFSGLQVAVITAVGVIEAVSGTITVGEFILFIAYNSMLTWPVRSLGRLLTEMSKTGVSLSRVNEILQAEQEKDCENPLTPEAKGDIEFKNVNFNYTGLKPVLKDISFTVKQGTTFGILGGTGSGKSTLMCLLDRLYDLGVGEGEILINGVNINRIKREHLRKNIGFVLQEPFLFSKTISQNIGIMSHDVDLRHVRKCASVAAVDDSITEFTDGYDTVVGERGVTLSGGQKQRVAIARMLMQHAPIMIFDDSLSAVDTETDKKIRAALRANTSSSTVILISHRITTLMHSDNIIVLDNGAIVQEGNHDTLSKQDGIYKQIYEIQGTIESELQQINFVGGDS